MINMQNNKKSLEFELNLIPVFDVLSACICFLLMTAVWVQVGSMNVSQALGGQSESEKPNPPSVMAYIHENGKLQLTLRDVATAPARFAEVVIQNNRGQINWSELTRYMKNLSAQVPQVKTALIMPASNSNYADILKIMDGFKQSGIEDIGISPL